MSEFFTDTGMTCVLFRVVFKHMPLPVHLCGSPNHCQSCLPHGDGQCLYQGLLRLGPRPWQSSNRSGVRFPKASRPHQKLSHMCLIGKVFAETLAALGSPARTRPPARGGGTSRGDRRPRGSARPRAALADSGADLPSSQAPAATLATTLAAPGHLPPGQTRARHARAKRSGERRHPVRCDARMLTLKPVQMSHAVGAAKTKVQVPAVFPLSVPLQPNCRKESLRRRTVRP